MRNGAHFFFIKRNLGLQVWYNQLWLRLGWYSAKRDRLLVVYNMSRKLMRRVHAEAWALEYISRLRYVWGVSRFFIILGSLISSKKWDKVMWNRIWCNLPMCALYNVKQGFAIVHTQLTKQHMKVGKTVQEWGTMPCSAVLRRYIFTNTLI